MHFAWQNIRLEGAFARAGRPQLLRADAGRMSLRGALIRHWPGLRRSLRRHDGFWLAIRAWEEGSYQEVRAGGRVHARTFLDLRRRAAAVIMAGFAVMPLGAAADQMALPSGQQVHLQEVLQDGALLRLRFLAPDIRRQRPGITYDDAAEDMRILCERHAPAGAEAAQVIVSLADRPVAFGQPAPDAVQFFEGFTLRDGHCKREDF